VIRFGPDRVEAFDPPIVRSASTAGIATLAFGQDGMVIAAGGDLGKPRELTDNVVVSADGGRTWKLGGRPTFPGGVYGVAYVPAGAGTVVAVGPNGAAWSLDHGRTWRSLDGADYWGLGFAPNGTGWLVGPGGRVARVTFY